jgi:hypothetical protein
VLVDEATVEVVIGSVVVVAALLVVAADVVVSETSNASSLVTHPTTNDLRRVPSPTSVRLHLILVIDSFWFFGVPVATLPSRASRRPRTCVSPTSTPLSVPLTFLSTTLLHSTRRRVAALGLLQVSFSSCVKLACCANAAAYFASLITSPLTTDHFASRLSFVVCDCRRTALHTTRLPSPHVRFSASLASDLHFSAVCTHSVRPSIRPSVRPSVHRLLAARTTTPRSTTRRRHNQRYKIQRAWPDAKRTNLALCSSQQP